MRASPEQTWPTTLWLVRHGESAGNVAREAAEAAGLPVIAIAERDVDVPLSGLGDRQSRALGRWFGAMPEATRPSVILTSPYLRAMQTTERVLIVAHQMIVLAFRYLLERMTEAQILEIDRAKDVANCGVTAYQLAPDGDPRHGGCMKLELYNFVTPLEDAGTPVTVSPDPPVAPR